MSQEYLLVPVETELDAFFGQYVAAEQAPGLVYGLVSADGLVHHRGFGVSGDDGLTPDADTLFPIASMTKSFMACAVLLAQEQGHLSLEDAVTRYVPELAASPGGVRASRMPTIRMLLSMCGGLTEDNAWVDPFIDRPMEDLLAIVAQGLRFSRLPGIAYEYSNLGFALACLALSRAVHQPLQQFLTEQLLEPLGLSSTYLDSYVPSDARVATGYTVDQAGRWRPFPPKSSDAFAGSGGLVSTVRDIATWITWLGSALRDPVADDDQVMSASGRRELQRIQIFSPPALIAQGASTVRLAMTGYALGLRVEYDVHSGQFVWHAGRLPGYKLLMRWHPASGNGIVVLTNSDRGDPQALGTAALDKVISRHRAPAVSVALWPDTRRLQAEAERLVRAWDDELAARIFAQNVSFDRPLAERREEIARCLSEVGPPLEPSPGTSLVSAASAAEITWSIACERGEIVCMVHLTPAEPAEIQEFIVTAYTADTPRSRRRVDLMPMRADLGEAFLSPVTNTRVTGI